jgi:hypothetical protein
MRRHKGEKEERAKKANRTEAEDTVKQRTQHHHRLRLLKTRRLKRKGRLHEEIETEKQGETERRSKAHRQQGRSAPPSVSFLQVCSFPFFVKIDACLSIETKGKQKTKEKLKDHHFCTWGLCPLLSAKTKNEQCEGNLITFALFYARVKFYALGWVTGLGQ